MKQDTTSWKRHEFPNIGDLGSVVLTNVSDGSLHMDFRAMHVACLGEVPEFRKRDDHGFTPNIHEAEADWHGSVKWDQCANFDKDDECMFHTCDREDVEQLMALMLAVYDIAKVELAAVWDQR